MRIAEAVRVRRKPAQDSAPSTGESPRACLLVWLVATLSSTQIAQRVALDSRPKRVCGHDYDRWGEGLARSDRQDGLARNSADDSDRGKVPRFQTSEDKRGAGHIRNGRYAGCGAHDLADSSQRPSRIEATGGWRW